MSSNNSDHAFVTGHSHYVCQDYANSGRDNQGQAFAIVSDGCSGSPDTDFGSRLLVKSLMNMIVPSADRSSSGHENIHSWAAWDALDHAKSIGLLPTCCDATLLSAYIQENCVYASMYGDGAFCIKMIDKPARAYVYSYMANYPRYISYNLQKDRLKSFRECKDNDKILDIYQKNEIGIFEKVERRNLGNDSIYERFYGYEKDCEWIALMSDGICDVRKVQSNEIVPVEEVFTELLNFKNMGGKFVQRRMNRFIKIIEEKGWRTQDDLSLAVINLS